MLEPLTKNINTQKDIESLRKLLSAAIIRLRPNQSDIKQLLIYLYSKYVELLDKNHMLSDEDKNHVIDMSLDTDLKLEELDSV